jgi:serine/threonine protein kinase/tetratricopeptide (TPR) repeat protein
MSDSISDPKHDPNRDPNRPATSSDSPRQPDPAAEETLDTLTPAAADAGAPPGPDATQALNAPANAAFVPGDILAGRFRVIRYIARGGMGEVYEAEDTELNDHVAVKTARFETVTGSQETERFRREIQLARKVTHPNVCRTFDVFRHTPPSSGTATLRSEVLIVSMEFLSGETLDSRMRRTGPMSTAEALPIITQLVAGLSAAHQVGIVHRDFKTSNVMLVPPPQGSSSVRAVITDFGLAHAQESPGSTLTRPGEIVGTPSYMAPEQVQGGDITPATDIYALGIVIYEMLTGAVPFSADTALATAMKRLNQPAPRASARIPNLDQSWDRAIARCLERNPANRFVSVDDVAKALAGQQVAAAISAADSTVAGADYSGSVSLDRRMRSPVMTIAIAAVILAALLTGFFLLRHRSAESADQKSGSQAGQVSAARRSIAILGFKNLSASANDSLGNILADSLWTQLDTDEVRFIPPSTVDEMRSNLGLRDPSASFTNDQVAAIKKFLGADVLVTGTYTAEGNPGSEKIAWNIHLIGTDGNKNLGSIGPLPGTENDLNPMILHAGRQIRQTLGISISPTEEARMDASLSTNPDAMRYFSDARDKLRNFDVLAATKSLQKSLDADPKFAQARSLLAEAWSTLGYDSKARDEAKKAMDLSSDLPTEDRDLIAARFYTASHDWDKAIEQYSQLWSQYRDDPRYALLLAGTQINAGKATAALTTLNELRAQNPSVGLQAQADLLETAAQTSLADYKQALTAATASAEKASSIGANLLLARARIQQCAAYLNLGQPNQATPLCEQAKQLNATAGDRLASANSANAIANVYNNQGNYEKAAPLYEEAVSTAQSIGDKQDEAGALNNLANIKATQNDSAAAIKLYEQSIDVARDRGDMEDLAAAQQNLAFILYASGQRVRGKAMLASALALAEKIEDRGTEARILHDECVLTLRYDELSAARRSCEKSLSLRPANDPLGLGQSLTAYGDVQVAAGDLAGAQKSYSEAISALDRLGSKNEAAYARISLAALQLEQNQPAQAEATARAAAVELASEKDQVGEASAATVVAQALLAQKQLAPATTEIQQATALAQQSGDAGAKLDAAITAARIDAQSGKADSALTSLAQVQKEARAAGLLQTEFDVRLATGEIQLSSGKVAAGKATLRSLATAAKSRGFTHIAQKATEAAAKS